MLDGALKARALILVVFLALLIVAAFGASRLSVDPNNRVFFSEDHRHFKSLLDLEAAFGTNTNLVYLIEGTEPLSDDGGLADAIQWLTDEVWSIERVVSVDSLANVPVVEEVDDEFWVENMLVYICGPLGERDCSNERVTRLGDPIVVNRLVDEARRVFAVVAKVDLFDPSSSNVPLIAQGAIEVKERFLQHFPEYELYLTGAVPMMQAFMDAAEADVSSLLAIAVVALAIGLYVFLGSAVATALLVLVGLSSVVFAFGLAGYMGLELNTATATVPLIVFTLVTASAMHLFLHLVREPNLATREAILSAVKTSVGANWIPILLTAATTALGLASLAFVASPPMKQLGLLSAAGVLWGAMTTLVVAPCAISFCREIRASRPLLAVQEAMNRYAKALERQRPRRFWFIVLFGFSAIGLMQLTVDEDFVRYFSPESKFRSDTESITKLLHGPYHLDVVYDSGGVGGAFDASSVRAVTKFVSSVREMTDVVSVVSVYDLIEEVNLALNGSRDLNSSSHDELAQHFLMYELSLTSGQVSNHLLDADQRRLRVSVLLGDVSMGRIRGLEQEIASVARDEGIQDRVVITGEAIPTAHLSSESIREMSIGIALSVLLSAWLVGLCFRNLSVTFVMFLATGVPLLAAFGVWGWIDSEIGMAAVLVVATTVGVVIDDTIHLTYRYVDGRRSHDLSNWGASAYSVHKAGTAVLINSFVLAAGLLVLSSSDFRMNSVFGFCASLVIMLALVYSLTLGPRLLTFVKAN